MTTYILRSDRERLHLRQNKPVSIDPVRVFRIEVHKLVKHDMGNGGHAHRGAGMTGICFEGGIDLQERNRYGY